MAVEFNHALISRELRQVAIQVERHEGTLRMLARLRGRVAGVVVRGEVVGRPAGWLSEMKDHGLVGAGETVSVATALRRIDVGFERVRSSHAGEVADAEFLDAVLRRSVPDAEAAAQRILMAESSKHEVAMTAANVEVRVRRPGGKIDVMSTATTGPSQLAVDFGEVLMRNHEGRQGLLRWMRRGRYPGWCTEPSCTAGGLKLCGRCGAPYCSAECQRRHWAAHRASCKRGEVPATFDFGRCR